MNYKDIISKFKTERELEDRIEKIIWGKRAVCPYCMSNNTAFSNNRYHCNGCNTYFNVKINTLFQSTKIDLRKWLTAFCILNERNISARDLAKEIQVTKDTAWLLMSKISNASQNDKTLLKTLLTDLY